MTDRRKTARRRTLLGGRIEIAKLNDRAVDCTVRDLSEAGARIAIDNGIVVPQSFALGISSGAPQPAHLIWYRDGHAGVSFAGA